MPKTAFFRARIKCERPDPSFCPGSVPRHSPVGGAGSRWAVLWPENGRASSHGVWKPPFWKVFLASHSAKYTRLQCPCHVQALAALPKPLMRTPDTVDHDTSCCGFCACEMNFLLIIKCSPTCGKLPFLGPFKSELMQSSFPHGTEETRFCGCHPAVRISWMVGSRNYSFRNEFLHFVPADSRLLTSKVLSHNHDGYFENDGALSQKEYMWGSMSPKLCVL